MFRYQKLGYVALNVSSVEVSTRFYVDIVGLEPVETRDSEVSYLRVSNDHHNLVLYQGQEPGLKRVGFELEYPEMVDEAFEYFKQRGLEPKFLEKEECVVLAQGKTFRFREPTTGVMMEYYSDMTQLPLKYRPTFADIQRLGHLVLKVPDYDNTLKMLTETLNFKTSDYVGENFAFMRCYPNPYHHSLGIARSESIQLHHVNFMVSHIDDIGKAINRLKQNNVPIVNGPGRHSPSGSIFLYFLDPDGITVEYSFGMEEFPEEGSRKAKILQRNPVTLDLWGGKPQPGYGAKGTVEGAGM